MSILLVVAPAEDSAVLWRHVPVDQHDVGHAAVSRCIGRALPGGPPEFHGYDPGEL